MTRKIICLSAAVLLAAGLAFPQAQSYGRLEGVVRDSQGLVLPGVSVTLTSEAIIGGRTATTDVDGSYRFLALPPGTYSMAFELAGFQTLNREGVVVTTGSTFTISPALELATVAETITVTGESPVVDVKTTGISATFDTTQIEDIPSATDMWAVLQQSPGVRMRGYDVGGSHKSQQSGYETFGRRNQNRIINEGINTTEGTGGAGGYYDYYAIQEFQVSAQGADVEMSTPGAQVVTTVKSGGNDFSSLTHWDIEPAGDLKSPFVTDNIDDDLIARGGSSAPVREFMEFHIDAGGPIVKDKAWFYGAYNYFRIDDVISGRDPAVATDIGLFDMISAKLNWQITQKDQFIGYSQWSLKQKPYRGLSSTIPADSILAQDSWAWLHKAEWQRVWNDRMFSNIVVAHFGFNWPMVPAVDPATRPPRLNVASNDQRGAGWQPFTLGRWKPQVTGQVSYYVPSAKGSHDFKFGFDWQIDSYRFGGNTNSGPIRYRDNSNLGPPPAGAGPDVLGALDEIDLLSLPTLNDDRNQHTDIYAQDTWTLNSRVTFTLGVRFGRQDLYYLASQQTPELTELFDPVDVPAASLQAWNNIAPRIGATFDLTGEGKTILKGYYGRYYGNIGSGLSAANPGAYTTLRYKFNDLNGNTVYDGTQELGAFVNCIGNCGTGLSGTPIASDAALMYVDEFSFSLERELMADTSGRFSYVRKQVRNAWAGSGGMTTVNFARATENLTQPFSTVCNNCPGEFAGTTLNLRTLPSGVPISDVAYGNAPGDTDSDFDTIQFAFNRRFRSNLFFNASYDFQWRDELRRADSEATGPLTVDPIDAAWFPQYNADLGQVFKNTNWNFRASARWVTAYEIGLAGTFRHQSGWPYAPIHRVSLPNVGTQPFFLEPIENNRSDNVNIVDIRADKSFTFGGKYQATVMADLYNLFNANPETNFRIRTGGTYDNIIEWLSGRTLKLGVRFQF
ncbi:MAG TPA: carboxypeptidase regulatory-like domain-containing protein [Vicinamibacteria bacterium]|nr:carboxypeptidase regulatory-like domain-containing protein [Vicinamibacteria bacterium]